MNLRGLQRLFWILLALGCVLGLFLLAWLLLRRLISVASR